MLKRAASSALLILLVFSVLSLGVVQDTRAQTYYTLTIKTEPCSGWATDYGTTIPSPGVNTYLNGSVVNVIAHPIPGWYFDSWILDGAYNVTTQGNTITITMNSDHVLWAIFNPIESPQPPTTPSTTNDFHLTVTDQSCTPTTADFGHTTPDAGTYTYTDGQVVTLLETPSQAWYFQGWTVDNQPAGNSTSISVTMNTDHTVTATFNPNPVPPPETYVTLTVLKFCFKPVTYQYGDISPDVGTYTVPVGTNMTFTAIDDAPPFKFYSWNFNGQELFGNTTTVTATADSILYAMFLARALG